MTTYRYAEMPPAELAERLAAYPVAVAPWGALEWHGPHLPYGLDGLVAEGFAERLAARTGAVLLPTTYLPITALPHPHSISFTSQHVRGIWKDLFAGLGRAGFAVVCLVSGHYAQGHEILLAQAAEESVTGGGPLVLAGTPLSLLGEPGLLDHAGRWETSQLQALRPDLVHLDRLPEGGLPSAHEIPVLGQDPRAASPAQGEAALERASAIWSEWIQRLLETREPEPLVRLYKARRAQYAGYVERYFQGSWEDAIQAWWDEAG